MTALGEVVARSRVYETAPHGVMRGPPQSDYLNAAVLLRTELAPEELMARLLEIEASMGRVRAPNRRNEARVIDLDILWIDGGASVSSETLVVPHPRLSERAFALVPLLEVAPHAPYKVQRHALGNGLPWELVDPDAIARLPLAWVHREQPNCIVGAREVTPAFYGSYDWHSAVHGHWTLARIARLHPTCESAAPARAALERSLTRDNIAAEVKNLEARPGFERPYGLAWLLTLAQELAEWSDADAERWRGALDPLTRLAATRLARFFTSLTYPVRTGEHTQTAFALGLAIDWSRSARDAALEQTFVARARAFHAGDRDAPLHREPSGTDFLSPALSEADVMRRVLDAPTKDAFARWLDAFVPQGFELTPVVSPDRADGRLAHLDGLNLSRAWMLEGIASALPEGDARRQRLLALSSAHAAAGMTALTSTEDSLTHWIGSFATYLVTRRGL
jgi:2-amino-4-hydroxy-6-hydroxymethyldihydropteridine diphosphokinase